MHEKNKIENYSRGDTARGIVTSRCSKGAFVDLDNGEMAFCVDGANLCQNTKIICSIIKTNIVKGRILVKLDSVYSIYEAA